jgi:hypothetical protein
MVCVADLVYLRRKYVQFLDNRCIVVLIRFSTASLPP